jgi:exonuclease III
LDKSAWFKRDYNVLVSNPTPLSGIVLFHNKNFTVRKHIFGDLLNKHTKARPGMSGRPYSIVVFDQSIIYVNVHFPHIHETSLHDIGNVAKYLNSILKDIPEFMDEKYHIILSGDFNTNPGNIVNLILSGRPGKKTFFGGKDFYTCCDVNGYGYIYAYDHIYNTIAPFKNYSALADNDVKLFTDKNGKKLMSDHIPVFATIPII